MNWKRLLSYALFVVVLFSGLAIATLVQENTQLRKELSHYEATYLYQAGFTTYQGQPVNYRFASFDGGQNWYSVEYQENWGVKVLGPADEGLLKAVMADNKLFEYVQKNGPINLNDPEGMKLLNEAGVTVEKGGK